MASSLLTAMHAASSEVWSHPSSGRGGTGGSGSWTKALTGSPLALPSTYIPTRFRCPEGPRYWPNANNGCRYWRFGGKSHIRLPLSPECGAVPSISRDPSFEIRLLKQGEPSLCHVIDRDARRRPSLNYQKLGERRMRALDSRREDSPFANAAIDEQAGVS